jgi:predicted house-cleaning noncanonical NTP pyrophosphatase (MazG superfamily)
MPPTDEAVLSEGKQVRDRFRRSFARKAWNPVVHTASIEERSARLRDKLREEVEEFLASDNDPEDLADILEVL